MNIFTFMIAEPVTIAKSNIILDVKPWDDETDMSKLEECVRSIEMEGLLWGACTLQMPWHVFISPPCNFVCTIVDVCTF